MSPALSEALSALDRRSTQSLLNRSGEVELAAVRAALGSEPASRATLDALNHELAIYQRAFSWVHVCYGQISRDLGAIVAPYRDMVIDLGLW